MRKFLGVVLALAALTVSTVSAEAAAAKQPKACTKAQAAQADAQLSLSSSAKKSALATHLPWGEPTGSEGAHRQVLIQKDYVIAYDDGDLAPVWSAEAIGLKPLDKVKRLDCFRRDKRITDDGVASTPADYLEPVFDQGHMTPSADQTSSLTAVMNSFLMSNMTPQYCHFNRGIWEMFEEVVRYWAGQHPKLYVLTGAVFADPSKRMKSHNGDERVAIPSSIYKVLAYKTTEGNLAILAIELPNVDKKVTKPQALAYLKAHIVTLAALQQETGLTFFPNFTGEEHEVTAENFWPVTGAKYSPLDSRCP